MNYIICLALCAYVFHLKTMNNIIQLYLLEKAIKHFLFLILLQQICLFQLLQEYYTMTTLYAYRFDELGLGHSLVGPS